MYINYERVSIMTTAIQLLLCGLIDFTAHHPTTYYSKLHRSNMLIILLVSLASGKYYLLPVAVSNNGLCLVRVITQCDDVDDDCSRVG